MGFTVPDPYAWDESFRVCYDVLDNEHKQIFQGIFDCSKAPGDAGKLASLIQVTKDHFANEEGMMKKANYGPFPGHKEKHDDFVKKLSGLSVPLGGDSIDFAKSWLVEHIMGVDFNYKNKL